MTLVGWSWSLLDRWLRSRIVGRCRGEAGLLRVAGAGLRVATCGRWGGVVHGLLAAVVVRLLVATIVVLLAAPIVVLATAIASLMAAIATRLSVSSSQRETERCGQHTHG